MSTEVLISEQGHKIGYKWGCDYTPLEYLERHNNPRKLTVPSGFRRMLWANTSGLREHLLSGGKIYGLRERDIIEENYNARYDINYG